MVIIWRAIVWYQEISAPINPNECGAPPPRETHEQAEIDITAVRPGPEGQFVAPVYTNFSHPEEQVERGKFKTLSPEERENEIARLAYEEVSVCFSS